MFLKMKIAFFTDSYLDLTGGIVTSIDAQKEALEKLGHTVYLFSTGYSRSKAERERLAKNHIFVVPTCKVFFRGLTPISRRPRIIEKWILKNYPEVKDFDVFHVHYESGCSIAGVRLGYQLKIPVVQTMHGREDMGLNGMFPFGMRSFIAMHLNRFHNLYLPHDINIKKDHDLAPTYARGRMWTLMVNHANMADVVLTPSKHFKKKLESYGVKHDIKVVSNGINDELIPKKVNVRELKDGETLKILWSSRFSAEKRGLKFLEALKDVDFPYELHAFGTGNELMLAKNYAKLNHMNVVFHGDAERAELFEYMKNSHLNVLASYNFDNQPMTMLEAETTGLPILICDPDMLEVTTKDGVFLADGPEPEKITKALNEIYAHPEMIKKMSEAMIKNRDEARQSKQIERLIKIYEGAKNEKIHR